MCIINKSSPAPAPPTLLHSRPAISNHIHSTLPAQLINPLAYNPFLNLCPHKYHIFIQLNLYSIPHHPIFMHFLAFITLFITKTLIVYPLKDLCPLILHIHITPSSFSYLISNCSPKHRTLLRLKSSLSQRYCLSRPCFLCFNSWRAAIVMVWLGCG